VLDVDTTFVAGRWHRHIPAGGDVFHEPADPADGRWQRGAQVDAWYFGDEEATAWAEWYRAAAELGLPPSALLPRDLWTWQLSLVRVADLSDPARLARVGLPRPKPGRAQWSAFQRVGETLWAGGLQAVLAPSAARPENAVLCVFRTNRKVQGCEPVPPPRRFDAPPAVPTGMTT